MKVSIFLEKKTPFYIVGYPLEPNMENLAFKKKSKKSFC
jgi:hypothetical protein